MTGDPAAVTCAFCRAALARMTTTAHRPTPRDR